MGAGSIVPRAMLLSGARLEPPRTDWEDVEDTQIKRIHQDEVFWLILEGTVSETGTEFFRALVRNVAKALDVSGAWLTEYVREERRLRSIAFWLNGTYVDKYEYAIDGTPCQPIVDQQCLVHIPDNIVELYPGDNDLKKYNAVSYMGVPLFDTDGQLFGHLAALDSKPMPREPHLISVFEIFAARAAAEYRRLKTEQEVRSREEQLRLLLDSAMDAIVVLDSGLRVERANPAAERVFGADAGRLAGKRISELLEKEGEDAVCKAAVELRDTPSAQRHVWFPSSLLARRLDGSLFPAEGTLSAFDNEGRTFFTLILRNVNDRLEAEKKIQLLTEEAEYLRTVMREGAGFGEIIGRSLAMQRLLTEVSQVAKTDATVLVLGETGTGKELIAHAIHNSSSRRDAALVRVNCAAIPGSLMESEFFGHEKGAFTGAVNRREGRFALADGGSIFLDEVGELPLDLQAKLLRVLQEGEFEPLGSTKTQKVDVRIIAATNRDLKEMVREGGFREDLFYRLNVFPVKVPPLRERGTDVALLANTFLQRFARREGRQVQPLGEGDIAILRSYTWPGNVRELENVVERALILCHGPRVDLAQAMPDFRRSETQVPKLSSKETEDPILTVKELEALERENILRALNACGGKISGEDGAAKRLGLPPSTLSSRMKALGIKRPGKGG